MKKQRLLWVLAALCLGASEASATQHLLRDKKLSCGLYFSSNRTHGERMGSLDLDDIDQAIRDLDISPDRGKAAIVAVGAKPGRASQQIKKQIRETLEQQGFDHVKAQVIERLGTFIEERSGLFAQKESGELVKLSSLDVDDLRRANVSPQDTLLLLGRPLFGKHRRDVDAWLTRENITPQKTTSDWHETLRKTVTHPLSSLEYAGRSLRHFYPLTQDLVGSTSDERRAAAQKILIPGVITFSVLLGQAEALSVLIPVTMVNAANSYSMARFRTTLGNWWRRSKTFFPSQWVKNVHITSFFTATIYWAGAGSLENLAQAGTLAGWQTFVTTKWLSVLFVTLWRAPAQTAVYGWEHLRSVGQSKEKAKENRRAGAAIEKYISYVMTQFYIYSILSESSFFRIVYSPESGLGMLAPQSQVAPADTTLMNANLGHVAMASVGVMAVLLMKKVKWLDHVAGTALKVDLAESKFLSYLAKPWEWFKNHNQSQNEQPIESDSKRHSIADDDETSHSHGDK